jgi:hypothetical protein
MDDKYRPPAVVVAVVVPMAVVVVMAVMVNDHYARDSHHDVRGRRPGSEEKKAQKSGHQELFHG